MDRVHEAFKLLQPMKMRFPELQEEPILLNIGDVCQIIDFRLDNRLPITESIVMEDMMKLNNNVTYATPFIEAEKSIEMWGHETAKTRAKHNFIETGDLWSLRVAMILESGYESYNLGKE